MTRYDKIKELIINKLNKELPDTLYYHGVHHVLDVLSSAVMIAENENISEPDLELLKVAVLFHDSGYTISSKDHEKLGCDLVKENLPAFGYNEQEIKIICGMIMATQYPQRPKTLLEEIICDADLDYLGRDDFFTIGNNLLKEMSVNGNLKNEDAFNELQENFLGSHHYFTRTANELRNKKKLEHLERIREMNKKG
jgi:exopolyphosphatase/pppGpp-phosphohydrolase